MFVHGKCRCPPCIAANDAYMAEYRRRNKAKIMAKEGERYRSKQAALQARGRYYYQRDKEGIRAASKTPEALARKAANELARRALKRGAFVEHVDPPTVYALANGLCGICGESITGAFHVDHIMPLSRRGLHSYRNVQPAHPKCNEQKHNRLPTIEELERSPTETSL